MIFYLLWNAFHNLSFSQAKAKEENPMIKHLFFDLDGTLLNQRGHLNPITVDAVRESGRAASLVSARAPMEMLPIVRALGLTGPQIAFNGGLVFKPMAKGIEVLDKTPLAGITARTIIAAVMMYFPTISISYYDRENWYTPRMDETVKQQRALNSQTPVVVSPAKSFADPSFKPYKIMLTVKDSFLLTPLKRMLIGLHLPDIAVQQSGAAYGADFIEITQQTAKKSRGISYVLNELHLNADEVAGFGDGFNDLPMLKMVGLPIVMDNAKPIIKSVATYVTKSNADDGVAYALANYPAFG